MSNIIKEGFDLYAIYRLCMSCTIGLILMVIFTYVTYTKYDLLKWPIANAVIKSSKCEQYKTTINKKSVIRYRCNLEIEFVHNNNIIKTNHKINDSIKQYNINDNIKIKYNPKNSLEVVNNSDSNIVYIGSGLSLLGFLMFTIGCCGMIYCMNNNCAILGGIFATQDVIRTFN